MRGPRLAAALFAAAMVLLASEAAGVAAVEPEAAGVAAVEPEAAGVAAVEPEAAGDEGEAPRQGVAPRISMDFERADLKDVLKVFSQQSGLNFVASSEAGAKKITLFLDNVTVQDALDNITRANELLYEREPGSGIFIVRPAQMTSPEIMTRVFPLKYTRLSVSALDVGGQKIVSDLAIRNEDLVEGGSSAMTSVGSGGTNLRGIDRIVSRMLSGGGTLAADVRTNSLIVTDYPQNLDRIEEILRAIDIPTRQVMIEVHMLEVRLTDIRDIGVEWGGTAGALLTYTGGSRSAAFPFQEELLNSFDAATGAKSAITLGTLSATNFTATLRFLMDKRDTRILARPRVLTVNNEAAIIKLVTETAVASVSTQTASEGVSVTTSGAAERAPTGIILKMTPQINADSTIELFLEPSFTTVAASTFFSTTFLDPTTRSVRTTVRVNDGETLVIGGLIDRDYSKIIEKIPFFGDLPLVGNAFRYFNYDDVDRELLIFLTPRIVDMPKPQDEFAVPRSRNPAMNEALRDSEMKRSMKEGEMKRALDQLAAQAG